MSRRRRGTQTLVGLVWTIRQVSPKYIHRGAANMRPQHRDSIFIAIAYRNTTTATATIGIMVSDSVPPEDPRNIVSPIPHSLPPPPFPSPPLPPPAPPTPEGEAFPNIFECSYMIIHPNLPSTWTSLGRTVSFLGRCLSTPLFIKTVPPPATTSKLVKSAIPHRAGSLISAKLCLRSSTPPQGQGANKH